jgi:sigma-B regulation protein RsbU (phosphoserine phosphatase)
MPGPRSKLRDHAFGYACLAVLFLVAVTNEARDARDRIDEMLYGATYVSSPFGMSMTTMAVTDMEPVAQAAGLRTGDEIVTVNGRPVNGRTDVWGPIRRARLGDSMQLRVRSTSTGEGSAPIAREHDITVKLPQFSYLGFTQGETAGYAYIVLIRVVVPVFCLALGFWVAAVCIGDAAAWMLLLLLLSIANKIIDGRTVAGNEDALQPLLTGFTLAAAQFAPVALALFAIAFPEPLAIDRRYPWIKWILFGPPLLLAMFFGVIVAVQMHHAALAAQLWPIYLRFEWTDWLSSVAVVTFFVALAYKTITASTRDARRRLLLLDIGAAVSFLPLLVLIVLTITRGFNWEGWGAVFSIAMLVIFPLTMAYVIVVHRAMDVRVVVRQGVQYVLARSGIRAIQIGLVIAVSIGASFILSRGVSTPRVLTVIAGAVAIVAISGRFADRLRQWVDRKFFREAYEADAILSDLASKVRTMVETGPLLETVATRVAASLHVPRIAILLDRDGPFRPAYALGYPETPSVTLAHDSQTVQRLREQPRALVEFDDPDSWVQTAHADERASLQRLDSELLLPLSMNEKLLGIMSLGPKQSEEPFSRTDIRLLDSVATQTGLALENGRLAAAIAAEVAARAKEKRDLEIAREVQERLFPQDYPPIVGLDYAGTCRPARGVGGDYYDFILLQNDQHDQAARLGIAIGDVSGKGIPAALLMATLRAYLRGAQTIHHQSDLTTVMRHLNKLVFESSAPNRYATFFYAELDAASRVMTYVNGGHNPPMLFRGGDVLRLEAGGPVIGLMEDCDYTQGCVTLQAGDLLVAFTDGITEAMNGADVEWGEEALIAMVRTCDNTMRAGALTERVIKSVDAFVADAPQHDDMTTIVLRAL